jgi:hypothetical protein
MFIRYLMKYVRDSELFYLSDFSCQGLACGFTYFD